MLKIFFDTSIGSDFRSKINELHSEIEKDYDTMGILYVLSENADIITVASFMKDNEINRFSTFVFRTSKHKSLLEIEAISKKRSTQFQNSPLPYADFVDSLEDLKKRIIKRSIKKKINFTVFYTNGQSFSKKIANYEYYSKLVQKSIKYIFENKFCSEIIGKCTCKELFDYAKKRSSIIPMDYDLLVLCTGDINKEKAIEYMKKHNHEIRENYIQDIMALSNLFDDKDLFIVKYNIED